MTRKTFFDQLLVGHGVDHSDIGVDRHRLAAARLALDDRNMLKQWKPSYDAGYLMQASLAAASAALGLLAAWSNGDWRWILGALLILANWPYTLIGIMPTNSRLKAIAETDAGPTSRALLESWGRLHGVRTVLGFAATLAYLWALH